MVNAPFRLYYAYNPLRVDTDSSASNLITPEMFPAAMRDECHLSEYHRNL